MVRYLIRMTHIEHDSSQGTCKLHWDMFGISMDVLCPSTRYQHISAHEKRFALICEIVVDGHSIHHQHTTTANQKQWKKDVQLFVGGGEGGGGKGYKNSVTLLLQLCC